MRRLRVLIDADLLDVGVATWTVGKLLAGFLTCQGIEFWRYSEDGPPPGAPCCTSLSGEQVAIGWVVTKSVPPGSPDHHILAYSVNDLGFQTDLAGEPGLFASNDHRTTVYETLDPGHATARRTADAVAACAARQVKADLYITNREYLHRVTGSLAQGVTFCTQEEGLALVGLYLRTQGRFLVWKDPGNDTPVRFGKSRFYWVGARELLPAGWRWFTTCVSHNDAQGFAPGPNNLTYLGGAVFQRIAGVLRARDDVLRAMNRKQDHEIAEDALTALDVCLVFLMGALDATARVAHHVLGLPAGKKFIGAGWQNSDSWLKDVKSKAPSLAAVVGSGTSGADTLTILRLLRNTVHGVGLRALGVGLPGRYEEMLGGVGLSLADRDNILAAAVGRGGREAWGLHELLPEMLHFDPGVLLERLLPAVIELLNELMTETPVETLVGVSLKPEDRLPPPRDDFFGERQRHSIRWQLGL